ncbi:MAG: hypothetical protein ACD_12C00724G0010 [uncultured bacterium]|nr:MAG: hypothetical protein ACD_12C00724G0010 [uncultured bacterium]
MKKLFLVLLGVVVISIIAFSSTKSNIEKQSNDIPATEISQVSSPPIIGVYYQMIDKQTAIKNNLVEGAYVTRVIKGSPAEKAYIREEDIIIEFDEKAIGGTDKQTLTNLVSKKSPGEKVLLKIWRNKEIKIISVILQEN